MAVDKNLAREVYLVESPGAASMTIAELRALTKSATLLNPGEGVREIGEQSAEDPFRVIPAGGERTPFATRNNSKYDLDVTERTYTVAGTLLDSNDFTAELYYGGEYDSVNEVWLPADAADTPKDRVLFTVNRTSSGRIYGDIFPLVRAYPGGEEGGNLYGERRTFPVVFEVLKPLDGKPDRIPYADTFGQDEVSPPNPNAAATVTTSGGAVSGAVVTTGGSGYNAATAYVAFVGSGSGAVGRLNISGGTVSSVTVISGGTGYYGTVTAVIYRTGGSGGGMPPEEPGSGFTEAAFSAQTDNGSIVSVEAFEHGSGYDLSTAWAKINSFEGTSVLKLVAQEGTEGGVDIEIIDPGHSYNPPYGTHPVAVYRTGGSGDGMPPESTTPPGETDAYLVPQLNMMDYGVDSVTVNVAGSGYGWDSWAMVSPAFGAGITPPTREAKIRLIVDGSGGVSTVQVLDRGEGYTTPPQIVVMRSGGPGDGYPLGWSEGTDPGNPTDPPPQSDAEAYVVMGGDLNDEVDGVYLQMGEDNIPMSGSGYDWNTAWVEAVGDSMDKARLRIEYLDWQNGIGQLSVAHRGSGYANAPSVVFHREGGDGQGYGPGETPQDD